MVTGCVFVYHSDMTTTGEGGGHRSLNHFRKCCSTKTWKKIVFFHWLHFCNPTLYLCVPILFVEFTYNFCGLIQGVRRSMGNALTHWCRVTHKCVDDLTILGSDNGLSPGRHQAIIWTKDGILLIGPLGTSFSEIEIHVFSFKKLHLKMSSGKWRPFCLGLNVLKLCLFRITPWFAICYPVNMKLFWKSTLLCMLFLLSES